MAKSSPSAQMVLPRFISEPLCIYIYVYLSDIYVCRKKMYIYICMCNLYNI